ncbi:MAG: type II toxin-antitoxin system RelE/ParE family toxin [Patescibacteria group bacterium]
MKIKIFNSSLEKFIQSLDSETIAKVTHTIELLEKFGNSLSMPHSKKIAEEIFELRIHGNKKVRILYAFYNKEAILLHGFVKKTAKIPKKEIKIATNRQKNIAL